MLPRRGARYVNKQHDLLKGCVAWLMPLPHNSGGANVVDLIGRAIGVRNGGTSWVGCSGQSGQVLYFNGSSGDVSVTGVPAVGPAMTVIVSGYLSFYNLNAMFLERESVNATWELFFESSTLTWRGASNTDRLTVAVATLGITDGVRYQFAVADNGGSTNPAGTIYLNGVAQSTTSNAAAAAPAANTNKIHLGNYDDSGFFWNGAIDYTLIYNRALSAAEIAALYVESRAGYPNLLPRRRSILSTTGAPPAGLQFNPAWAAFSNTLLGGGFGF